MWCDLTGYGPGSSPLARGAQAGSGLFGAASGLIPAGAGSTSAPSPSSRRMAAHPRWRGEHMSFSYPISYASGSSPLARGALVENEYWDKRTGLIPAGAGSTDPHQNTLPRGGAHPRWRGEHIGCEALNRSRIGSSPLARGAPSKSGFARRKLRLIPAGAGSTRVDKSRRPAPWAHPRWRGEHSSRAPQPDRQ